MLREIAPEVKLEDLSELGSIHDNSNDDFPRPFPDDSDQMGS